MRKWIKGILVLMAALALYGLAGREDYLSEQRWNAERAWSVAQWERAYGVE